MNYEEKYKEAIESIKRIYNQADSYGKELMEKEFPELRESEDEKIRKEIIDYIILYQDSLTTEEYNSWISWLEKQGEQKSTDEIKQKFKVGDWITNGEYTWMVIDTKPLDYILQSPNGDVVDDTISYVDEEFHLWTIQDTKDGDVLANKYGAIFINAGSNGGVTLDCYCYLSVQNKFCIEEHKTGSWLYKNNIKPATKEQRDTLERAMTNAGYRWNKEELKLEKI